MMTARGMKVAYTKKFDLSELPEYKPGKQVAGTLRLWGSNYIMDGPAPYCRRRLRSTSQV
jgi:hypothetical protein